MKKIFVILSVGLLAFGCTDLDEELNDTVNSDVAAAQADTESFSKQHIRP